MTSTIQVENNTLNLLRDLKRIYEAKTYDETINLLVRKKVSKSGYGKLAQGKKYSMKQILKDLRDKGDRY